MLRILMLVGFICVVSLINTNIANTMEEYEKKTFRLNKYAEIWARALKQVPKEKLEKLWRILRKLDKTELDIKHQKETSGADYEKEMQLSIRDRLAEILEEFNLYNDEANRTEFSNFKFQDERLNKLWAQAMNIADYSNEELRAFHQELKHMEEKISDYQSLSQKVDKHETSMNENMENDAYVTGNYVDPSDDQNTDGTKLKGMQRQLKNQYHELNDQVLEMEQKVYERSESPDFKFTDPRVIELWNRARKSGKFTDTELESVKEELQHFQTRISKLHHWERVSEQLKKDVHEAGKHNLKDEYENTKDKIIEHKKFVKKYHATMIDRVYRHKSEL